MIFECYAVIARSVATKQSKKTFQNNGLLRRYAPRNDGISLLQNHDNSQRTLNLRVVYHRHPVLFAIVTMRCLLSSSHGLTAGPKKSSPTGSRGQAAG